MASSKEKSKVNILHVKVLKVLWVYKNKLTVVLAKARSDNFILNNEKGKQSDKRKHKVVNYIVNAFDNKPVCAAIFVCLRDLTQWTTHCLLSTLKAMQADGYQSIRGFSRIHLRPYFIHPIYS